MATKKIIGCVLCALTLATACTESEIINLSQDKVLETTAYTPLWDEPSPTDTTAQDYASAVTYTTAPALGAWNSINCGLTVAASCGTLNGGTVKMKATAVNTSGVVTLVLGNVSNSAFSTSGTWTLYRNSLCGTVIKTVPVTAGTVTTSTTITLTHTAGYVDVWGVFASNNGAKYNAGHVTVNAPDSRKINTTQFLYYNQGDLGCTNSTFRAHGCLPATCLMGRHLANTYFAVKPADFTAMCTGMGTSTAGTNITNAANYLKQSTQLGTAQSSVYTTTSGSTALTQLKTYLAANKSVACLVKYSSSTKTVTSLGNLGHFVLVVGVVSSSTTSGTVYYYDPNNTSGVLKTCSVSTFLAAMPAASSSGYYNMLKIG